MATVDSLGEIDPDDLSDDLAVAGSELNGAPQSGLYLAVYIVGGVVLIGTALYGVASGQLDLAAGVLVSAILFGLTSPIARYFSRRDQSAATYSLIMAGVIAKFVGSIMRYLVLETIYRGSGDSLGYHLYGKQLASPYRHFNFGVNVGPTTGTGFIRRLIGVVYAMFGVSRLTGFFVFGWFGFLGALLLWRAFVIGYPEGNVTRYGRLVFFLPSLMYWPSAVGKEAWMVFGIGWASYGVANLTSHRRVRGMVAIMLGISVMVSTRPHVALIVVVGLMLSFLSRRPGERSPFSGWATIVVVVVVVGGSLVVVQKTQKFLGVGTITQESVDTKLVGTQDRTAEGGSQFSPVVVHSPKDLPLAFATVAYRPFPWEAHSLQGGAAAIEGLLLIGLTIRSHSSVRQALKSVRRAPYVTYALGYLLAFVVAFSSFSNFGILARQRSQLLPIYLVFLSLTVRGEHEDEESLGEDIPDPASHGTQ